MRNHERILNSQFKPKIKSVAGVGALAITIGLLGFSAAPASATDMHLKQTTAGGTCWSDHKIEEGHVDAFYFNHQDGEPFMGLKDDTVSPYAVRDPETVELHANESSLMDMPAEGVPEGLAGQQDVYHLPLVQEQGRLWPGWESQPLAATPYDTVDIHIQEVHGPGEVYLWTDGGAFGEGAEAVLNEGRTQLPGTIHQSFLAHTHAHWAFTEPGAYYLIVTADLHSSSTGESISLGPETYLFTAGDDLPAGYQGCQHGAGPDDHGDPENGNGDNGNGDTENDNGSSGDGDQGNGAQDSNGGDVDQVGGGSGGGSGDDGLADTGFSSALMTGMGIGLLVTGAGTAALLLNRRSQEKSKGRNINVSAR